MKTAAKLLLIYLPYAYTCDVVKQYSYFQIKIKINENLSSPMPSFMELGVANIASFCFLFCYCYMEVRVMFDHVTCVYVGETRLQ